MPLTAQEKARANFVLNEVEVQQALRLFAYGIEHLKGYMTATEFRVTTRMQERLHTLAIDLNNDALRESELRPDR